MKNTTKDEKEVINPYLCTDPENCTEVHNEEDPSTGEIHHYGCECSWCIQVYWSLKR